MALLPGYRSLGGSARRVEGPDGQELSRRQYENIVAREAGWQSWSEWQRTRNDPAYQHMVTAAVISGRGAGWDLRARDSELSRLWLAARRTGWGATDTSPSGPMARLLVYLGWRQPDASYAVGDTPPRR